MGLNVTRHRVTIKGVTAQTSNIQADAYRLDDPPSSPTSEGSHSFTDHRYFCKRASVRLAKAS